MTEHHSFTSEIYIIFFEAASGHRSAAEHIMKACKSKGFSNVEMVNLTEITDFTSPFGKIARAGINYFNWSIRNRVLFDLNGLLNISFLFHDTLSEKSIQEMAVFWKNKSPKLVISVTPMYNPMLIRSLKSIHPDASFLLLPVDMTEEKDKYWFLPNLDMKVATACDALYKRAIEKGIEEKDIFQLSGMPARISPIGTLNKDQLFKKWGFNPENPTCFVSFGGQGTKEVLAIAKAADRQQTQANFLFFCGKNSKMYDQLQAMKTSYPKAVFSYLPEAPTAYLHLVDLVLGKPGAMTLAEAQLAEKPLFALKSTGLRLVQKGNEKYIEEQGIGKVFSTIVQLVQGISDFPKHKSSLRPISKNDALNELVHHISNLLELSTPAHTRNYEQPIAK